ncbi:MAG: hypothetical protein AAGG81_07760 [Chlamydiota bacterium]
MTISEGSAIFEEDKTVIHGLIEDYNPRDEEKIHYAISIINDKLLKAKNSDNFNEKDIESVCSISSQAVNYIQQLSEELQDSLYKIRKKLDDQLKDREYQQFLSNSDQLKSLQKRLCEIFCKNLTNPPTTPPEISSEKIEIEDRITQEILLSFTKKYQDRPLSIKEIEGKKNQISHVKDFGQRFMRDYYPIIVLGKESSPSDLFLQHTHKEFLETFPHTIPNFLFHPPKIVEQHEKNVIISVLEHITFFFHDYNQAIKVIKKDDKEFEKRKLSDKDIKILSHMRTISLQRENSKGKTSKKVQPLIPERLNEADIMIHLTEILKMLISQWYLISDPDFKETPKVTQKLIAAMIPLIIVPIIFDRILSPHAFRLLFINLLLRDINIPIEWVNAPTFKDCDASDQAFTRQVGEIAQNLSQEILDFGKARGFLNSVKYFTGTESLGELIQKGINHVMGTDTCFIPITILDHLLYRDGEPTLIGAFSTTAQHETNDVEEDVKKRIYKILKDNLPPVMAKIIDKFTSINKFCETLSVGVFELTQSKKVFLVFSCYFLNGLKKGLSPTPVKEKK